MQNQSQTIQQKQKYLCEQIIDQGYDTEDFVDYIQTVREDGADINSWKLAELKQVVQKYINLKIADQRQSTSRFSMKVVDIPITVQQIIKNQEESPKKSQNLRPQSKRNSLFVKPLLFPKYNTTEKQFTKKVNVHTFKKYITKQIDPEITVEKPELISTGGIFGIATTTTIWFTIKNNLFATIVKRTDEDFFWLRTQLLKLNPGLIIPPLKPPKANYEKQDIDKRCWMINFFMNSVFKNALLFNNKMMVSFISWTDYENFSKLKDQINVQNTVRSLNNVISIDGSVDLEFSLENIEKVKKLEKFSQNVSDIYTRMKQQVRELIKNFDQKASTILRIGQNFAQLQESYSNIIGSVPQFFVNYLINQNLEFNNTIINLNNIMMEWGNKMLNEKDIIQKNIGYFFKACKQQFGSIKELIKRRNDAEEQFLKFKVNLYKKKEKVFPEFHRWELPANIIVKYKQPKSLPKQKAFEIMLPKQTEQEKNLKQWTGYLNKCCQNEFTNICPLMAKRYEKSFVNLGKTMSLLYKRETQIIERFNSILIT